MKTAIVSLLLLSLAAQAEDLALADGKKMTDVTITRAEPDGLVVMTDSGIVKVRFGELPEETQKKYGYDPAAAAKFTDAVHRNQSATIAKGNAIAANTFNKEQAELIQKERIEQMQKLGVVTKFKVVQLVDDGALVKLFLSSDLSFVRGFKQGVDGDHYEIVLYPGGRYKYEAVTGAQTTVPAYCMRPEDALALTLAQ